ncbi:hypothetical protein CY34DRAFT_765963 [Suillus luteus UH-Slu-Lm8-n1]|uniref:Ran GTPase-activating protein 1 n=1 Tax=Suillus luteus UH-Slu-Lm8-n1 TaxID=930992 RepID=A0A0D0B989_9AGAM|nr:hypothetical protein CY34DRAFT_765963 [Suillus luteus UH-Slu-Lm8-n1]
MAASKTIFDIRGKQLKLETAADVGPFITGLADLGDIFTGRTIEEILGAIQALLDSLSHKTSLREINLNDNAFGERVVPFLEAITPFIAEAACKSAPTDGSQSNLEAVICGQNRLEDPGAATWAKAFEAHKTLTEVQMPQNGIHMDDVEMDEEGRKAVRAWGEAVKTSWLKLRFLDLSGCMLSNGEGKNLQELRLQSNNLDAKSYEVLAQARLDLQDNDDIEDSEHLDGIAEHLKAHGSKLIRTEEEEEENVEESPKEAEEAEEVEEIRAPLATEEKSTFEMVADTLAILMSKVHVG